MDTVLEKRILLVENNDLDYVLIKDAFTENGIADNLYRVKNGLELFAYLQDVEIKPSLIILDLNMPGKDGRDCLIELKSDKGYKTIPVIILTTSNLQQDVEFAYLNDASAFIRKPPSFEILVKYVESMHKFWFETVTLPQT